MLTACVRHMDKAGTGLKELPTCFGDVYLVQGVCKRFHQVASKQSEKAFQLLSNAVGQIVECQ